MSAVKIDDDFVRFGSKSYAVSKINSIEVREHRPYDVTPSFFLAAITIFFGILALAGLASGGSGLAFLGCLIAGVATVILWLRAQYREFQLFLMTSSSEVQAFVSQSEEEVLALQDEIEAAIVRNARGSR